MELASCVSVSSGVDKENVTQLDDVQRVREFGTLNPKWDVCTKSFLSGLGERKSEWMEDTKETKASTHSWA